MQDALPTDDGRDVAGHQRAGDAKQPRPADLLLHADGKSRRLAITVKPRRLGPFRRCDPESAQRQTPRTRCRTGRDAQSPPRLRVDVSVHPDVRYRVPSPIAEQCGRFSGGENRWNERSCHAISADSGMGTTVRMGRLTGSPEAAQYARGAFLTHSSIPRRRPRRFAPTEWTVPRHAMLYLRTPDSHVAAKRAFWTLGRRRCRSECSARSVQHLLFWSDCSARSVQHLLFWSDCSARSVLHGLWVNPTSFDHAND